MKNYITIFAALAFVLSAGFATSSAQAEEGIVGVKPTLENAKKAGAEGAEVIEEAAEGAEAIEEAAEATEGEAAADTAPAAGAEGEEAAEATEGEAAAEEATEEAPAEDAAH